MTTTVFIGGIYCLVFAVFHVFFWKIFDWKNDLRSLTQVNRGIMHVLNLCLTFLFFFVAYISLFNSEDLVNTKLGKTVLVGISIFCLLRAIEQIIFFGLKKTVSILFFVSFLIGAALFAIPVVF